MEEILRHRCPLARKGGHARRMSTSSCLVALDNATFRKDRRRTEQERHQHNGDQKQFIPHRLSPPFAQD
jgi:hypothetical protein